MTPHARRRPAALAVLAAVLAVGLLPTTAAVAQSTTDEQIDIGEPAASVVWLCRPGLDDNPCLADLTATVLHADASTTEEQGATPSGRPPIDCFYVYPTVSAQTTTNADLALDPEIRVIAEMQASRFAPVCRVFAPIYPQITIAGLARVAERPEAGVIAYAGVVDAWRDYLEHDNDGRGWSSSVTPRGPGCSRPSSATRSRAIRPSGGESCRPCSSVRTSSSRLERTSAGRSSGRQRVGPAARPVAW